VSSSMVTKVSAALLCAWILLCSKHSCKYFTCKTLFNVYPSLRGLDHEQSLLKALGCRSNKNGQILILACYTLYNYPLSQVLLLINKK
jgi:hypothetical protein